MKNTKTVKVNKNDNDMQNQNSLSLFDSSTKDRKISFGKHFFKTGIILITCLVTFLILFLIGFVIFSASPVFQKISFWKFIFSAEWKPDAGKFGIGMIILMTLVLLTFTMLFAVPLTLFSTIFIAEYLSNSHQKIAMKIIQLLAGVPSVVFGLFAREFIGTLTQKMGALSNDNLLAASLTMTLMAIPTMISLSYNAIKSVPDYYRMGSIGLGVSKEKTAFTIVIRSIIPKIVSAVILGMSRVIGETMAIMMIAGNSSGKFNTSSLGSFLFSSISTLSSTIGLEISETSSPEHRAALFAIAMFLFLLVFIINLSILLISHIGIQSKSKRFFRQANRKNMENILTPMRNYNDDDIKQMVRLKVQNKWAKKTYSIVMLLLMWLSTIIVIASTFWVLGSVIVKGIVGLGTPSSFVSFAGQDGIFAALFTTILLIIGTLLFAIPIALATAIYLSEYANPNSPLTKILRFLINLLSSTPSIIFGIFGLQMIIVVMGLSFSVLASSLTMTMVVLPMLITNFEEALSMVHKEYREAGAGLGMSSTQQLFKIVLPYAREGILTGIILAMARIVGESAPVYLTLGTAIRMPTEGFLSSGATLTTAIYMLASEARPGKIQEVIYLLSLITMILVFTLNQSSSHISAFLSNKASSPIFINSKIKLRHFIDNCKNFRWHKFVHNWQDKTKSIFNKFKKTWRILRKRLSVSYWKYNIKNWKERRIKYKEIKDKKNIETE